MSMRTILYARISLEEGSEYGLSSQLRAMQDYAQAKGYRVVAELTEEFTGKMLDRPQLNRIREMVRGHQFDVLIAHSSKFSDQKLLDEFIPNSEDLELTEHIRLKDRNTLEDRITIQDPQYFTRPWDTVLIYKRQPEALFPFHEDVCLDRKSAGELPLPR